MHTLYIFMTHTHSDARSLKCSVRCYEHVITLLLKRITPKEIEPLKGNIIFYLTISRIVLVTISQLVAILFCGTSALWSVRRGQASLRGTRRKTEKPRRISRSEKTFKELKGYRAFTHS